MQEKKVLRQEIKQLKKQLSESEAMKQVQSIYQQLVEDDLFKKANHILFYWSLPDEVPTQEFILNFCQQKNIYLPVINGNDLDIVLFEGEESLISGDKYGIPEPSGEKIKDENVIELVIVPGMAFDRNGNRMGRGAGYYDRILNRLPKAKKMALAYDFQIVDEVPVEPHDIKMDAIISIK